MRFYLAIWLAKIIKRLLRFFGRGGTTLPGLVAWRLDPDMLGKLSKNLKYGSVIITGTNGKTTTSRLLTSILERNGYVVLSNSTGSNLERGLVSCFLDGVDWKGRSQIDVAVLEVDEADLINIIDKVLCRELVVTNFFRDQLDRYGELDAIRKIVIKSIQELTVGSRLVLNADDPLVSGLAKYAPEGVDIAYFGLDVDLKSLLEQNLDVRNCEVCGGELSYNKVFLSHLGDYYCKKCGFKRPKVNLLARRIILNGVDGSVVDIVNEQEELLNMEVRFPGVFNVYNLLAAMLAANFFEIDKDLAVEGIIKLNPAFGRFEKVKKNGTTFYLLLAKNPTGFNELLKTILFDNNILNLVFVLNDNYADGRDISWIWDVDFEKIGNRINWLALSGNRAEDLMVRVKYSDMDLKKVGIQKSYKKLFDDVLNMDEEQSVFVMATYTGMLEIREEMYKRHMVQEFWNV